jgi:hypothetical protein
MARHGITLGAGGVLMQMAHFTTKEAPLRARLWLYTYIPLFSASATAKIIVENCKVESRLLRATDDNDYMEVYSFRCSRSSFVRDCCWQGTERSA